MFRVAQLSLVREWAWLPNSGRVSVERAQNNPFRVC